MELLGRIFLLEMWNERSSMLNATAGYSRNVFRNVFRFFRSILYVALPESQNGLGLSSMQAALGLLGQMSTVQLEQNVSCLTMQKDEWGTKPTWLRTCSN